MERIRFDRLKDPRFIPHRWIKVGVKSKAEMRVVGGATVSQNLAGALVNRPAPKGAQNPCLGHPSALQRFVFSAGVPTSGTPAAL